MAVQPQAEPRFERYDTPDGRLAEFGVSLARESGVWIVDFPELPVGIFSSRTRFEFDGPRGQPPEPARDLVAAFARGARLSRVIEIDHLSLVLPPPQPSAPLVPGEGDVATPSPAAVIRAAFAASVRRWIQHDPGVRLGLDAEDLHQARVATRRLRSDLGSFEALLDRTWARDLRAALRPLAAALGAVRDLDVLLARLRARNAALSAEEARAADDLVAGLEVERVSARAELLEHMRTPEYLALLDRALGAAREPALLGGVDGVAADALVGALRVRWRKLERDVRRLDDEPSAEALHRIRIRAKRCRYVAEALAGVDGKRVKALARALSRLQDVLGEHQDAMIAGGWLRRAGASSTGDGRFVAGLLAGAELAAAEAARGEWRRVWRRARDCASKAQLR